MRTYGRTHPSIMSAQRPPRSVKFACHISLILKRVTKKTKVWKDDFFSRWLDPNFQDPTHPAPDTKVAKLAHNNWYPIHPTGKKKAWRGFIQLVSKWLLRSFLDFDESLVFEGVFVCTPKASHFKDSTKIRGVWVDDTDHNPRSIEKVAT